MRRTTHAPRSFRERSNSARRVACTVSTTSSCIVRSDRASRSASGPRVDADMAHRYAEVSGDWSDHHFDVDAAHRSGFERVFLHGLGTMALCAQAVVELVAGGDPERVRRVAVRFASPTFLAEQLHV